MEITLINSQPPRLRLSLPLKSVLLESQQVHSAPTTLLLQRKCLGYSLTRPLVTHYLDIRRHQHARYANVDAIRLRKHLQGHHTNPSPPSFSASFNPSLFPSIITMSPAPLGKFPFGELTGKGLYSVIVKAVALTKQFAYLLKYYRN